MDPMYPNQPIPQNRPQGPDPGYYSPSSLGAGVTLRTGALRPSQSSPSGPQARDNYDRPNGPPPPSMLPPATHSMSSRYPPYMSSTAAMVGSGSVGNLPSGMNGSPRANSFPGSMSGGSGGHLSNINMPGALNGGVGVPSTYTGGGSSVAGRSMSGRWMHNIHHPHHAGIPRQSGQQQPPSTIKTGHESPHLQLTSSQLCTGLTSPHGHLGRSNSVRKQIIKL